MLAITVIQEDRHRHDISATGFVIVRGMHPVVGLITIPEIPDHTVALVVHRSVKVDGFVCTELIFIHFCTQDIIDIHLRILQCSIRADRIGIGFEISCSVHVRHNSLVTTQCVRAFINQQTGKRIFRIGRYHTELGCDTHIVVRDRRNSGSGHDDVHIMFCQVWTAECGKGDSFDPLFQRRDPNH